MMPPARRMEASPKVITVIMLMITDARRNITKIVKIFPVSCVLATVFNSARVFIK